MVRVGVKPTLLEWARDRSGRSAAEVSKRFPKYLDWLGGTAQPTLKQLEQFAKVTYTPFGYLLLAEPPPDSLPIPDLRSIQNRAVTRPSPGLLETIHTCERRQAWYRTFASMNREERRTFVGSAQVDGNPAALAARIRSALRFEVEDRRSLQDTEVTLRELIQRAEALGVLVMCSGIVGTNTARKLDVEEFRGFALVDDLAPLVFVNARDARSAQVFTLVHELAHLWIGEPGVSNDVPISAPTTKVERYCNAVAAEVLAPRAAVLARVSARDDPDQAAQRLAREFKISRLVAWIRLHELGIVTRERMQAGYQQELERQRPRRTESGGDFHRTHALRMGRRFATALIIDALEGNTLQRDALRLLGISKPKTLHHFAASLGIAS